MLRDVPPERGHDRVLESADEGLRDSMGGTVSSIVYKTERGA